MVRGVSLWLIQMFLSHVLWVLQEPHMLVIHNHLFSYVCCVSAELTADLTLDV